MLGFVRRVAHAHHSACSLWNWKWKISRKKCIGIIVHKLEEALFEERGIRMALNWEHFSYTNKKRLIWNTPIADTHTKKQPNTKSKTSRPNSQPEMNADKTKTKKKSIENVVQNFRIVSALSVNLFCNLIYLFNFVYIFLFVCSTTTSFDMLCIRENWTKNNT